MTNLFIKTFLAICLCVFAISAQDDALPVNTKTKAITDLKTLLPSKENKKPLLINFWATWCGPCREEIPSLVELQQNYGDQLVVLGVSIDDPLSKLKPYATEMHMNYPVLVGKDRQDVQDAYGPLFGIPVSVFVDRDGRIWKRHSGIASKEQFEREIKALL